MPSFVVATDNICFWKRTPERWTIDYHKNKKENTPLVVMTSQHD
jgi:hypothetical protein